MKGIRKLDLIDAVATDTGKSKKEARFYVESVERVIESNILSGNKVFIAGVGNLYLKKQASKTARNPRTGEKIVLPESNKVAFKVSSVFRVKIQKIVL